MGDTVGEQREWNMGEAMNLTMGGETTKSFQGCDWGHGRIDITIFQSLLLKDLQISIIESTCYGYSWMYGWWNGCMVEQMNE